MTKILSFIILFGLGVTPNVFAQSKTSLDNYLEQVREKDPAYKAAQDTMKGSHMRSVEGDLLTLPVLGAKYSHNVDQKNTYTPIFNGTDRVADTYLISVDEQFRYGTHVQLAYGYNYNYLAGVPPVVFNGQSISTPVQFTASPSISITQSLWRNGLGSETAALVDSKNAKALEIYYKNRFTEMGILTDAQNAYFRLFYAQQTVRAVKESLSISDQLLAWAQKRLNQGLGERSDYLQTKATHDLRELDLSSAEQEVLSASRFFNSLRGVDSELVTDELEQPNMPVYKTETVLSDKAWRDDIRAARKTAEALTADSLVNKAKNTPTFDLIGGYSLNSLAVNGPTAIDQSFQNRYPAYNFGFNFSMPLAFGKSSDVREGYEKEAIAAKMAFQRKAQEQERDFKDLQTKIETTSQRLKLAKIVEESQGSKAKEERERHKRGRTTFFEVLQFEQDHLTSQLTRIKTESELSGYLIQLQQYREE